MPTPPTTEPERMTEREPLPEDHVAALLRRILELVEYAHYYLQVRLDLVKLGAWKALVSAALGVGAALVLGAFAVTCVVFVLYGGALGLSRLFGDRFWLGFLVLGVLGLVLLGGVVAVALAGMRASRRRREERKYDERRRAQRARFGRDIGHAAGGNGVRVPAPAGAGRPGGDASRPGGNQGHG
ncbi:MAG: hypothetical protein AB1716_06735 [Planctomycetota bacterium]